VPQLVYKRSDQLTDKMSDSDESFDILRDIYSFEPLVEKVTESINCEELAAASAYMDPEQPPVLPTPSSGPQQKLEWCVIVCVGISLINTPGLNASNSLLISRGMHGALQYVAYASLYRDVPPLVCFVIFGVVLVVSGRVLTALNYMSDIIIGI